MKKKSLHYGWVIAIGCMLSLTFTQGLVFNAFGLFIVPICEELGCSRTSVTVCQTMFQISGMVASFSAGILYSKFRLKRVMEICSVVTAAALIGFTFARTTLVMTVLSLIMGLFGQVMGWIPTSIFINNWFDKDRNTATGLAMTGSNVGGALFSVLTGIIIGDLGWRMTYRLFAVAGFVLLFVINFIVMKERPEDVGLKPYGAGDGAAEARELVLTGPGVKKVLRMPAFYMICASSFLLCMSSNSVNATLSAHMRDMGMAESTASYMFTVYMAGVFFSKLLMGRLFDRIGLTKTLVLGAVAEAAGVVLLIFSRTVIIAAAAGIVVSLGNAMGPLMSPAITRELFGSRDYSAITGYLATATSVGGMIAVTAMGVVRDAAGSYTPGYIVLAPLVLLTAAGYTLAIRSAKRKQAEGA